MTRTRFRSELFRAFRTISATSAASWASGA